MSIQDEFKARLERDVARFINHATQSGMDVAALEGSWVINIQGGKLVGLEGLTLAVTESEPPKLKESAQKLVDSIKQKKSRTDD
jgi:hypothetical protein